MTGPSVEVLRNMLHHNFNEPRNISELCSMRCTQLKAGDILQVGDLVYCYSTQLDSFTIYDVIATDDHDCDVPPTKVTIKSIDSDSHELYESIDTLPGIVPESHHLFTYYRPDPQDRERVERDGFKSKYCGMFSYQPPAQRQLAVRIYYVPPTTSKRIKNAASDHNNWSKAAWWIIAAAVVHLIIIALRN